LYADESGSSNQDATFVLGGFLGEAQVWAEFAEARQAVLDAAPRIEYFKMREAASPCGQFANWKARDRDKKLGALSRVIQQYKSIEAIHCSLDYEAFNEILKPEMPNKQDNAYFLAFHSLIGGVCYHLIRIGYSQRVELFFDENPVFGPRAKKWYPFVKDVVMPQAARALLPVEPRFEDDQEFIPLQAADMFAWLYRATCNGQVGEFSWLVEELKDVPLSPNSQLMTGARLREILSEADTCNIFTPEVVAKFEEFMGESPFLEKEQK